MIKNDEIIAPILIIGFNRPDIIKQTFEYIRKAKPIKLYVAIDGPRPEKEGEADLVKQVKEVVENVDWPCETHYKYNETNKGAEVTVSSAISWVFEKEEYAIILEDDIIAPMSFLKFAQEMLIKYKTFKTISYITGCNFTPIRVPDNSDYFFAKYGHYWGWATWKRAWKGFDLNITVSKEYLKMSYLKSITSCRKEARYYKKLFININKRGKGNNAWDTIALYLHRINGTLAIIPRVNLTSNIGVYGLHAHGRTKHHFRPFDENFIVKRHPDKIEYFEEYDKFHFKNYILKNKSPLWKRIIRKLKSSLTIVNYH